MIKSMTGFGKAEKEFLDKRYTVEIKTLNSKQFDMLARLPMLLKEKELEIRSQLITKLVRGKVEITISSDESGLHDNYSINRPLLKKYYHEIRSINDELGISTDQQIISSLLRLPDILQSEAERLSDDEWNSALEVMNEAIEKCNVSRYNEGEKLESDFISRIDLILGYMNHIPQFEPARIEKMREKFRKDLHDYIDEQKIDENRFEQEIIFYLEKIDITEEKVRLGNHCDYFMQTMEEDTS
nr:DUF1732 domain-containing protein [Bacteroidota bacterium]